MNTLNTPLNSFINTGLDEQLSKGYHMEQVTVHGKHGDYLAMRRKGTNRQPLVNYYKQQHSKKDDARTTRSHSNPKSFNVVGEDFRYMSFNQPGSVKTLQDVVGEFHDSGASSQYSSLNDFIKANYFVSDGNTNTQQCYKVDGKYTPERLSSVHEPIIQSYVEQCPVPPEGQKPICFLYGGGSASGKSSVVSTVATPIMEAIGYTFGKVDSDDIKEKLPEHQMFMEQNATMAAFREHKESSDITNETIERLISDGRTFAYDGTMSSFSKYKGFIEKMNDKGYEIRVIAVDIPVEEAKKRAAQRKRKIPEDIVVNTHSAFSRNFIRIIEELDIDAFCLYDNSQPEGEKPTMILDSESPDVVGDQTLYERFMKKGGYM